MTLPAILRDFPNTPICGRCLIVVDARITVRAKHPNGEMETIRDATWPIELKAWVLTKYLDDHRWSFEIGATTHRFIPIATMYGDPVCAVDLHYLVERERSPRR